MKNDNETEDDGKERRVSMEISVGGTKKEVPPGSLLLKALDELPNEPNLHQ